MLYQRSTNASAALVYNLSGGGAHQEHGDEGHGAWGVMLESQFEHEGGQRIAVLVEDDSGGDVLWLAPACATRRPRAGRRLFRLACRYGGASACLTRNMRSG